ncbi:MAG: cold-shock protein [Dehalococcoidia bacterium]
MAQGFIKRLITTSRFGFIRADKGEDIFFHRNELVDFPFESLAEGQRVQFELTQHPKGPRAIGVKPFDRNPKVPFTEDRIGYDNFLYNNGKDYSRARRRAHIKRDKKIRT